MKYLDHRLNYCLPLFTHGCLQDPFALETGPSMRLNTLVKWVSEWILIPRNRRESQRPGRRDGCIFSLQCIHQRLTYPDMLSVHARLC